MSAVRENPPQLRIYWPGTWSAEKAEALHVLSEAATICRKRLSWVERAIAHSRREGIDASRLSREARERNRTLRCIFDAYAIVRAS